MNIQDALRALNPDNPEHWTVDGVPRVDVMAELTDNPGLARADIIAAAPEFTRESSLMAQAETPADESPKAETSAETDEAPAEAAPATDIEVAGSTPMLPPAPPVGGEVDRNTDLMREQADQDNMDFDAPQDDLEAMQSPMAPEAPSAPEEAPEPPPSALELLHRELEASSKEMYTAQAISKDAKTEADAAADRVNALNRKIEVLEKADPHHDTAHIRAYLAQQSRNRLTRAGRMQKFLGESGVALKDVAKELDPRAPLDRAMHGRKAPRGSTRPVYIRGKTS